MDASKYNVIMDQLKQGKVWLAIDDEEMIEFHDHHDEFGRGEELVAYEENQRTKITLKK